MSHPPDRLDADLVLSGGGVKGIGHVGAVSVLLERGYHVHRVAGTSAGAVVAALVAAQMPADRMRQVMAEVNYRTFRDQDRLDRIPVLGPGLSLLCENGIFEGARLHEWLGGLLAELGVETFGQLRLPTRANPPQRPQDSYRLVVMAADIDRGELVRLPWDYHRYGLDPDDQPVADAVRASMSIPFFYEPFKLQYPGGTSTLVDGGVLTNFPIDTFDRTDGQPPNRPTFGITLLPRLPAGNATVLPGLGLLRRGPLHFLERLVTTMTVGHDQTRLQLPWIAARSITVDTGRVTAIDFDLAPEVQQALYANGRRAAEAFLETWDWEAYLEEFRPPPCPPPAVSDPTR